MANHFMNFIKAVFGQDNDNISRKERRQIKEAEEAGERAAQTVKKRLQVEHVDVNPEDAINTAARTNRGRHAKEHTTGSR